ncbi:MULTISPECIES: hypothetical protein [Cupriavidus]|jgi:hypothetical protein|uniref:Protein (Secreted)corresponding to a gene involved in the response to chromate n=1 Tax=Cupriavidus metallidurans (strain ATCC 43123 / DSM 2839 / NBRC 102507 / CH34) TaxID=266264 RepID=Q1L9W9_CUPMC|nr:MULTISPECIES: hypothetical protein [Cupriavidus]ABF13057.1 protein (secreted)corresponding to a gene involved in the response to chromate [Cupriavidus metallidurans CH34]MBU66343.1 hypothetical protein [Cupriavidus sp.]
MKRILTAVCAGIAITSSATAATAQDVFRHLKASEIKRTISGKVITDGPHWADKFASDGTVESIMQGQVQKGRWSVRGSNLCLAYPSAKAEECFEVWRYGQMIEYRRDGVLLAQGKLVIQ